MKHSDVTLAWDATSLDAQHVNEVHVTVPTVPPTGCVLQVSVLQVAHHLTELSSTSVWSRSFNQIWIFNYSS